jgi:hypothetical protein
VRLFGHFLALGFSCSQAESTPAPAPVTQTVVNKIYVTECTSTGIEPITARFEVQILGEELFDLLRRIPRQNFAFFIPFYPPVGKEPQIPGLTAPRLLGMGCFSAVNLLYFNYLSFKFERYVNTIFES